MLHCDSHADESVFFLFLNLITFVYNICVYQLQKGTCRSQYSGRGGGAEV